MFKLVPSSLHVQFDGTHAACYGGNLDSPGERNTIFLNLALHRLPGCHCISLHLHQLFCWCKSKETHVGGSGPEGSWCMLLPLRSSCFHPISQFPIPILLQNTLELILLPLYLLRCDVQVLPACLPACTHSHCSHLMWCCAKTYLGWMTRSASVRAQ